MTLYDVVLLRPDLIRFQVLMLSALCQLSGCVVVWSNNISVRDDIVSETVDVKVVSDSRAFVDVKWLVTDPLINAGAVMIVLI